MTKKIFEEEHTKFVGDQVLYISGTLAEWRIDWAKKFPELDLDVFGSAMYDLMLRLTSGITVIDDENEE